MGHGWGEEERTSLPGVDAKALLNLQDWRRHALQVGRDQRLRFVGGGSSSSSPGGARGCQAWVLTGIAAGRYTLQHAASHKFLTTAAGELQLSDAPESLQLFMDMDRRVALRLAGKTCLQSGPGGAALAGRLPLGRDRSSKLFQLYEAGLPLHSLQAWPLRAALRCEQDGGGYMSASGGGALSVTAPAVCCSEEFLLALGEAAPLHVQGSTLVAPKCNVWTADGKQLLSRDAGTGQLLLQHQHGSTGRELFTLQLSASGELSLVAEPPEQQLQPKAPLQPLHLNEHKVGQQEAQTSRMPAAGVSPGELGSMLAPVVIRGGALAAYSSSKASKLSLELASNKPALLLTAHGQLLSCRKSEARPCGTLLPPPTTAAKSGGLGSIGSRANGSGDGSGSGSSSSMDGARSSCLAGSAWLLEHHGNCVYSLRHGASGRSLYIDDLGAPCLGARGGAIIYPDERLLFWMETAWVTLQGTLPSPCAAGLDGGEGSSSIASNDAAALCSLGPAGFVQPLACSAGLTAAGFSIRSVRRVGGRHLFLSVMPDGLLTTVNALDRPTRWELFSVIDYQTLLHSPLRLLDRLPCAAPPPAEHQVQPEAQALPRAMSMQALSSYSAGLALLPALGRRSGSHGLLPRAPCLTTVHEHAPHSLSDGLLQQQLMQQELLPATPLDDLQPTLWPPRCGLSETALADMEAQQGQAGRPQWLVQLLQQPRRAEGFGLCSAASLQEIACRQLCVMLVGQYQQQHGGKAVALGVVEAVEAELTGHLPEEVASRIGHDLRLLSEPPPPTKFSLHQLSKAAAVAGGPVQAAAKQLVPAWTVPHLQGVAAGGAGNAAVAALLEWQPTEAYLCCSCRGASGALLPLDPYINPSHHLFLTAMEWRARGGGRVRLRARRRLDREDPVLLALKTGKLALLAWAVSKTLAAVFCGSSSLAHEVGKVRR